MKRQPMGLSSWFRKNDPGDSRRNKFTEPHFNPYTRSIGELLLAWNDLHERLAVLFVLSMGLEHLAQSSALWHEMRSDAGKRLLLDVAINNMGAKQIGEHKTLVSDINWILKQAKQLEGYRDDAAHTPFDYIRPVEWRELFRALVGEDPPDPAVVPNTSFANPRALRLKKNKPEMLIEYRYARERILVLRDYALAIEQAWGIGPLPWPDRPDLPERRPIRRSKGAASRRRKK